MSLARNNPSILQELAESLTKQFTENVVVKFQTVFLVPLLEKPTPFETTSRKDYDQDWEEGWLSRRRVRAEEIGNNEDSVEQVDLKRKFDIQQIMNWIVIFFFFDRNSITTANEDESDNFDNILEMYKSEMHKSQ
jgi:hypothetical protein